MANYTADLTSGKTFAAINSLGAGYNASEAFDNNTTTLWHSYPAGSNQWIRVDFGSAVKISKLRIYPFDNYVGNFSLQGSNDASSWTTVMSGSAPSDTWYTFEFENNTEYRYYRVLMAADRYHAIREIEMMAIEAAYKPSGTYTSQPIPLDDLSDLRFFITKEEPTDTSVTASYAINDDDETTPGSWIEVSNEDEIPMPEVTAGKFLWLKLLLETSDGEVTPSVSAVWLEEADPDTATLQINLTYAGRMKHPQGVVTLDFTGSLQGKNSTTVAPFVESFNPQDLVLWFNPNAPERFELADLIVSGNLIEVSYVYAESMLEYFEFVDIVASGTLIHVDDIET